MRRAPAPRRPVRALPDLEAERSLETDGWAPVAGIDEVGRGAWAGPVSVGVVVVPTDMAPPAGIRDSKLVPEHRRDALFEAVDRWCTAWAVGHAGPEECDRWGMTVALRMAAWRALEELPVRPAGLLLDGAHDYLTAPGTGEIGGGDAGDGPTPVVRTVVRGDATCVSIAAASLVAKVTRDRMMRREADNFPAFDFDRNKGYPSPVHRTALAGFGLTSIHRRSWSYVDRLPYRSSAPPDPAR